MTYSLPFGLKQVNGTIYRGVVKDKTHLDQLLGVKSFTDVIHLLEIVA